MSSTTRLQKELEIKTKQALATSKDPLERFRAACLAHGAHGIKGIGVIMDEDHSKTINMAEFKIGIADHGLTFSKPEIEELFRAFDTNNSGSIDYEEFLFHLRPPLDKFRLDLIGKAFAKLDKDHDGKITIEDLRGVYSAKSNPKYLNGEWSEDDVLRHFLDTFAINQHVDGIVTRDEFISYYSGVSASIDEDAYFDLMMRRAWKI